MKNGIYPIVERDEKGLTRSNGKCLALFDIGDKYDPVTAAVRTLAVTKIDPRVSEFVTVEYGGGITMQRPNRNYPKRDLYLRLEGTQERPNFLYVNSKLKRSRNPYETFYLNNFFGKDEELITSLGRFFPFEDEKRWSISEYIQPVKFEDIDQHDPNQEFRFWEINPRYSDWLFKNFIELARNFVNNSRGRK